MRKGIFDLEVLVHGKPVREFPHQGLVWVEGRKGSEFVLHIRNNSYQRALAIPTVDGISVVDGQPGNFESGGYIIGPWSDLKIPGWRKDLNEVAKFYFSGVDRSYAVKTDNPASFVGVLGVAWFFEKVYPPTFSIYSLNGDCNPPSGGYSGILRGHNVTHTKCSDSYSVGEHEGVSCNFVQDLGQSTGAWQSSSGSEVQCNANIQQELGTGWGEAAQHQVTLVNFEKATVAPAEILEIHYDSRENLAKRGIDIKQKPTVGIPSPFPGQKGFCPPPSDNRR